MTAVALPEPGEPVGFEQHRVLGDLLLQLLAQVADLLPVLLGVRARQVDAVDRVGGECGVGDLGHRLGRRYA
jgi:hypothetical protein